MTARAWRLLRLAVCVSLAAWIIWKVARSSAQPMTLIRGDNNVVIFIAGRHARHQLLSASSESFSDFASAEPTCRKARFPPSFEAR